MIGHDRGSVEVNITGGLKNGEGARYSHRLDRCSQHGVAILGTERKEVTHPGLGNTSVPEIRGLSLGQGHARINGKLPNGCKAAPHSDERHGHEGRPYDFRT